VFHATIVALDEWISVHKSSPEASIQTSQARWAASTAAQLVLSEPNNINAWIDAVQVALLLGYPEIAQSFVAFVVDNLGDYIVGDVRFQLTRARVLLELAHAAPGSPASTTHLQLSRKLLEELQQEIPTCSVVLEALADVIASSHDKTGAAALVSQAQAALRDSVESNLHLQRIESKLHALLQ
jgi:hypothetical protein